MTSFVSVCSGIEAATLALAPLGGVPVAYSEIDPAACKFLAHKYPTVPNVGDMMTAPWESIRADLLIGGTPCQEFSQMGRWRVKKNASAASEAKPRTRLAYRFTNIADWIGAKSFIWENSPNVLTARNGEFFRKWLAEVSARGFVVGWRVMDTREDFGLPARRTRLYAVGHRGGVGDFEAVERALFQPTDHSGHVVPYDPQRFGPAEGAESDVGGRIPIGFNVSSLKPSGSFNSLPTLIAGHAGKYGYVARDGSIRKLTAQESERAMGFPIGYTACAGLNDTARQMLVGNSFSPVVIGAIARGLLQ